MYPPVHIFSRLLIIGSCLLGLTAMPVQAATKPAVVTQSTQLKKQSQDLLQNSQQLKADLNKSQSAVLKKNNKIVNTTLDLERLHNQKTAKSNQLEQLQHQITQLEQANKKQDQFLTAMYQSQQKKNNAFDPGTIDPAQIQKERQAQQDASRAVHDSKNQIVTAKSNLKKLQRKQQRLQQTQRSLDKTALQLKAKQKELQTNKNRYDQNSHSNTQKRLATINTLQTQYQNVKNEANEVMEQEPRADLTNAEQRTVATNLKTVQVNLEQTNTILNLLTGKTLDNIQVNVEQLIADNTKAFQQAAAQPATDPEPATNNSDNSTNPEAAVALVPTASESNPDLIQQIINTALSYVGTPYVWGGADPSGFDCSGLMQYVFGQFGITLPRVSQDQSTLGTRVELNDLQPGDLLFWGPEGSAHHVALYIGNNEFVQAPEPGECVKVTNINYFTPDYAKRLNIN